MTDTMSSKVERWGWLYGTEAYNNIESNLLTLDLSVLTQCLAEFDKYHGKYPRLFEGSEHSVLVAELWPLVDELARCDDGGYAVHLCPYGCSNHKMILV